MPHFLLACAGHASALLVHAPPGFTFVNGSESCGVLSHFEVEAMGYFTLRYERRISMSVYENHLSAGSMSRPWLVIPLSSADTVG